MAAKEGHRTKVSHQHPAVLRSSSVDSRFVSAKIHAVYMMPQTNSRQSGLCPIPHLQRTTGKNLTVISPLIPSKSYQMPKGTPVYVRFKHMPFLLTAIANTPRSPKKKTPSNRCRPTLMISGGTMFYENVIRQEIILNAATSANKMKSTQVRPAMEKSASKITSDYIFIFDASLIFFSLVTMYVIYMLASTHDDSRLPRCSNAFSDDDKFLFCKKPES